MSASEPPRLAIYGVGQYGSLITRFASEKGWPVVAAFNRAGPKVGQDLGRVAGLGRDLGVVVQDNETGDFEHLDADIGVVTHMDLLRHNMDAYRKFLGAGMNVICHGGQSYLPQTNDPVLAAEIESLALANDVTFTGSGIWDMSRIWSGILTAGPCTDITALRHFSLTDPEGQLLTLTRGSAFNQSPERFYERGLDQSPVLLAHKAIPELVLDALGYDVTESRAGANPSSTTCR
jgi:4-hydroxy-tetrahydrodipicolinate reductase